MSARNADHYKLALRIGSAGLLTCILGVLALFEMRRCLKIGGEEVSLDAGKTGG